MADLLDRSLGPTVVIETRFPLAIAPVLADANQLELAILNLTMNGRDAMAGGGRIEISAQEQRIGEGDPAGLPDGRYVVLCVADEGAGMDDTTRSRATEPFFTTKGVGKGTGLGLSMVEGLAAQSGGKLTIESQEGVGTKICLWLPVALVNREAERTFRRPTEEEERSPTPPLSILAVDDDALVLLNTAAMLEELGHVVHQASSGAEALAQMDEHEIDLLVTDFAMPQMNGSELADAVLARQPGIPVLIATGFADIGDSAAPQFPRLAKPFTQEELAAAVAGAIDPEQARRVVPLRAR
jgi:CheY-like chemotaxis protein